MPKVVYTPVKGLVQEAGTNVGGAMLGFVHDAEPQTLAAAGVVSVSTYVTLLTGNGAKTLAAGTIVGQLKKLLCTTADTFTVTIANPTADNRAKITFDNAGDVAELMWNGSAWRILSLYNVAAGGIVSPTVGAV